MSDIRKTAPTEQSHSLNVWDSGIAGEVTKTFYFTTPKLAQQFVNNGKWITGSFSKDASWTLTGMSVVVCIREGELVAVFAQRLDIYYGRIINDYLGALDTRDESL